MGCISLLGGVHFAVPGVQMGCNPETGWGASSYGWGAIHNGWGADYAGWSRYK